MEQSLTFLETEAGCLNLYGGRGALLVGWKGRQFNSILIFRAVFGALLYSNEQDSLEW